MSIEKSAAQEVEQVDADIEVLVSEMEVSAADSVLGELVDALGDYLNSHLELAADMSPRMNRLSMALAMAIIHQRKVRREAN